MCTNRRHIAHTFYCILNVPEYSGEMIIFCATWFLYNSSIILSKKCCRRRRYRKKKTKKNTPSFAVYYTYCTYICLPNFIHPIRWALFYVIFPLFLLQLSFNEGTYFAESDLMSPQCYMTIINFLVTSHVNQWWSLTHPQPIPIAL